MATQTKGTKASTAKAKGKAQPKPAARPAPPEKSPARVVAESVVDLPVGALLEVSDRLNELLEPFSRRAGAERQLKAYRTRLRRSVKRTERRGATARRKATSEAKRARGRVEREARRRERSVRTTLKRSRTEAEQRVRKAIEAQTSRAQGLIDQVGEQLSAIR
ncbi:MAG TPA: hypothetical protein VFI63_00775 [Solirubrobacterales bacterium]|nr:hypothetical protein [Solirubrobacterales bacterium]